MRTIRKVRYAVLGQGWFSQAAVLPAFASASATSELAAIISGDPVKREELARQYGVPAYPYEEYDEILAGGGIEAVYNVLPNSMHCDYTLRAARAGIHVLCEKPMAANSDECQQMITACDSAGVKLMVAYRLHFEEGNLEAIELLKTGRLGEPRLFQSINCQQVDEGNTRLDAGLAGSPLMDIGIYCINASRYLFQDDPIEVSAFATYSGETRFSEVPEMVNVLMRFARGRQASFLCGFGEAKVSMYRVVGTRGDLCMEPAYSFDADLNLTVTIEGKTTRTPFKRRDQVGAEIVYFSDCIRSNRSPEPSGLEGLADLRIIEGIHESLATGQAVQLGRFPPHPRPDKRQMIHLPPIESPELINAAPPSGG